MRYNYPVEWLKIERLVVPNVGKDVEELETLIDAGIYVIQCNYFGK